MTFPYIKYKCEICTSKLGQLYEPLVILVAADPYGQVMNDLRVVCKLHYIYFKAAVASVLWKRQELHER